MSNLMTSLFTGVSGLQANQNALNTAAHNLANINTRGYTRQQIVMSDFGYNTVGQAANYANQVGLGTAVQVVKQVRDRFYDEWYREEFGRQGYYDSQLGTVREMEDLFGETEGVRFEESITDFWEAIQEVTKSPSLTTKTTFANRAQSFIERAQLISDQIQQYQEGLNIQIYDQVAEINKLGQRITWLNGEIQKTEACGIERANDFRDERNNCLDDLANLANISFKEDMDGMVNISIEGRQFVTGTTAYQLSIEKEVLNYDEVSGILGNLEEINQKLAIETDPDEVAKLKKQSEVECKELRRYIKYTKTELPDGRIKLEAASGVLLDPDDGARLAVAKKECTSDQLIKPVWAATGDDVFDLSIVPNIRNERDIGLLKGILIARGSGTADYTDVPIKPIEPKLADFKGDEAKYKEALAVYEKEMLHYERKVELYNVNVQASAIRTIQAQFDQMVHGIVTAVNNILSPNEYVELNGEVTLADGRKLPAGTKLNVLSDEAPIGKGPDQAAGEALFNRKGVDRYSNIEEAEVEVYKLDKDGSRMVDEDGNFITETRKVRIYNEEDPTDKSTLFTLGEIEVNQTILANCATLPLHNPNAPEEVDKNTTKALATLFNKTFATLGPNNEKPYTFNEYYQGMIGELGNRGNTLKGIASTQETTVNELGNARQNVIGVSSNEELTNMIKFQHAYNASSRYVNTISQMLEDIVTKL